MCGIIATICNRTNGFDSEETDQFAANLFVNQWRGQDSTGIVNVAQNGDAIIVKALGGPTNIYSTDKWDMFKKDMISQGRIAFGHGRQATRGTVTIENAHPFRVENKDGNEIILVHNGTLHGFQRLPGFDKHDVD